MLLEGERLEKLGDNIEVIISKDHAFGADAVLLAHFARSGAALPNGARLCDLGTGCGIIPFLWARAGGDFSVDAVELQTPAAEMAVRSVELNSLGDRIHIINADLRTAPLPRAAYDLVTCNPPYKKAGTGLTSRTDARLIARHEVTCTLEDIVKEAAGLLRFDGRFCLCHRPERLSETLALMSTHGLEPKRLRMVQLNTSTAPWLFLAEGKKGAKPHLRVEPTLLQENPQGGNSEEMQRIYGF